MKIIAQDGVKEDRASFDTINIKTSTGLEFQFEELPDGTVKVYAITGMAAVLIIQPHQNNSAILDQKVRSK